MIVKFKKLPGGTWFCTEGKEWEQAQAAGSVIEYEVDDGGKPKTDTQRAAIHVWLRDLATILNDSGLERIAIMEKLKSKGVELPWTLESTKEIIYKPVLEAMTGKTSTEKMNTVEPCAVAIVIARHMGERYGVTCPPWPTRFGSE